MLFRETIADSTWALLQKLSAYPELGAYALAGGTALALQIGHRISYDLDFFGNDDRSNEDILAIIESSGTLEVVAQSKRVLVLLINNIKVDFVRHPYQLLEPINNADGLRLTGLKDIGAMKLHAIAGRGRRRDFTDLYFLLRHLTLTELLEAYKTKIFDGNELMVLRSLTYFEDAENDPEVKFIGQAIDWKVIKAEIIEEVRKIQ